jgi:hypothetical protein
VIGAAGPRAAWGVVVGLLLIGLAADAAEPRIEVSLTPRFGVEDTATLTVRIVEAPSGTSTPDLGELNNLDVVGGPSRGTEFSFINGVASSAVTFTYGVQASEVGPASAGPVTVQAGDKLLRAEPVAAEVVPGSVVPPRRGRRTSPFFDDPFESLLSRRRMPHATVVLRHALAPRRVVVGEPVMATVVLDSTGRVDDFNWLAAPTYPGWWAQRVQPPQQITPEVVEVEGTRFSRFTIARHVLVPLKAGVLTIPPVQARIGVGSRSLLDPGQAFDRAADQIEVEVVQRPPPPDGYAGAVGQLEYSAGIEPEEIEFGASAVLTVRLDGSGNLPLVEAPAEWPKCVECETYPPEEESKVTVDQHGIHGSRSWRVTVVPRQWGELVFDEVRTAVFDPRSGSYRSQTLGPLTLDVLAPPPTPTPVTRDDVETEDLPAVPPTIVRRTAERQGVPEWLWISAALVVGVVAGGLVVWLAGRRRRGVIPPRQPDQTPAERARELQVALERWWLDARARRPKASVEEEMEALRRDLEAVRFAPGRADHSETIVDLEERFRKLLRRA